MSVLINLANLNLDCMKALLHCSCMNQIHSPLSFLHMYPSSHVPPLVRSTSLRACVFSYDGSAWFSHSAEEDFIWLNCLSPSWLRSTRLKWQSVMWNNNDRLHRHPLSVDLCKGDLLIINLTSSSGLEVEKTHQLRFNPSSCCVAFSIQMVNREKYIGFWLHLSLNDWGMVLCVNQYFPAMTASKRLYGILNTPQRVPQHISK